MKQNKCGNLGFKSECYVYFKKGYAIFFIINPIWFLDAVFVYFETFFSQCFVRKLRFSSKPISNSESALKTESIYICCG